MEGECVEGNIHIHMVYETIDAVERIVGAIYAQEVDRMVVVVMAALYFYHYKGIEFEWLGIFTHYLSDISTIVACCVPAQFALFYL